MVVEQFKTQALNIKAPEVKPVNINEWLVDDFFVTKKNKARANMAKRKSAAASERLRTDQSSHDELSDKDTEESEARIKHCLSP